MRTTRFSLLLGILLTCVCVCAYGTKCDKSCEVKCGADCSHMCNAEGFWLELSGPKLCADICGTDCKGNAGNLRKFEDHKWKNCNVEDCYTPCNEALKAKGVTNTNTKDSASPNPWNECILSCITRPDGLKPEDAECKTCDAKCVAKCGADCKKACDAEGFWLDAGGPEVCHEICGTECEKTVGNMRRIEDPKFKSCEFTSCYEPCAATAAGLSGQKGAAGRKGPAWNSCILSCITRPDGVIPIDVPECAH